MLVSSAVVRKLRGDIGDISMSQIWRQQHLHLPPELTVGSSIVIFPEVVFPGDLLFCCRPPCLLCLCLHFAINLWIFLTLRSLYVRLTRRQLFRHPNFPNEIA